LSGDYIHIVIRWTYATWNSWNKKGQDSNLMPCKLSVNINLHALMSIIIY